MKLVDMVALLGSPTHTLPSRSNQLMTLDGIGEKLWRPRRSMGNGRAWGGPRSDVTARQELDFGCPTRAGEMSATVCWPGVLDECCLSDGPPVL